jgi:sulfoxide reductase catalytic subunit YedY
MGQVRRNWEMPEHAATPEAIFLGRRGLLAAGALLAAPAAHAQRATPAAFVDPTADLYPAARNLRFRLDRPVTAETDATSYNNFYEFGTQKAIARQAQRLKLRPWQVRIDGLVANPRTVDVDTLIRAMPIEERLYRFRCVEAWAMAVPWTGFELSHLLRFAEPQAGARFIVMQTFGPDAVPVSIATGFREPWYPWPYTEVLTMAEAGNELAFMATGLYGKPAGAQNGAPLRLVVPWKYGFKSVKSVVRISFVAERPKTFWEEIQPSEYGFWANVNPDVPHPRWSQASERMLGSDERRPTQIFNGYGEFVAGLYEGLANERLFA